MKKIDKPAIDATLESLNQAREQICRGTAAVARVREALGRPGEEMNPDQVEEVLEAALDKLYEGAAALQFVRPLLLGVVDNCEILQGALRRQLRAARREGPGSPPFPEPEPPDKKPSKKPRDGA